MENKINWKKELKEFLIGLVGALLVAGIIIGGLYVLMAIFPDPTIDACNRVSEGLRQGLGC